jgi:hypothetical protein
MCLLTLALQQKAGHNQVLYFPYLEADIPQPIFIIIKTILLSVITSIGDA